MFLLLSNETLVNDHKKVMEIIMIIKRKERKQHLKNHRNRKKVISNNFKFTEPLNFNDQLLMEGEGGIM
jgi:hypothetical protein